MQSTMYRQEICFCEKPNCRRCRLGHGHIYWYAYHTVDGQTNRSYVGVKLPLSVVATERFSALPSPLSQEGAKFRLYTLGQVRLERRTGDLWQIVTNVEWYHDDVRTLLACLVSNTGPNLANTSVARTLMRSALIAALWPRETDTKAAQRLHKTVHELRNVLEPGRKKEMSSLLENAYQSLSLASQGLIWCDADAFEMLVKHAQTDTDVGRRERLFEDALSLYRGNYFPEERREIAWVVSRRDFLRRQAISSFLDLADMQIRREALVGAVELLRRAMTLDSTSEAIAGRLMRSLAQLGQLHEALRVYRKLFEALSHEEEPLSPSVELRTLYQAIRQRA